MTKQQLEKLLEGATPEQVLELTLIARDPLLQVQHGLDFGNIGLDIIPGAVRFGGFASLEDSRNPEKFTQWSCVYVNGPMSPMYRLSESDLRRVEATHGAEAVKGLRNCTIFCLGKKHTPAA